MRQRVDDDSDLFSSEAADDAGVEEVG